MISHHLGLAVKLKGLAVKLQFSLAAKLKGLAVKLQFSP